MAGIMDFLQNMTKEQNNALLTAGSQILMRSGPGRPFSVGQAMGTGGLAYQDSMTEQQQRAAQMSEQAQIGQMRGLQIKNAESDLAAQQRAREEELLFSGMAKDFIKSPGQQAAALPGGPTAENASRIPEFTGEMDIEGYTNAMMAYNPLKALDIKRKYAKSAPELAGVDVATQNGMPVRVLRFKDGTEKISAFDPQADMTEMNLGGVTQWVDKNRLQNGQKFQRTMTPDGAASNAIAQANLGISRERLGIERERAIQGRSTVVQTDAGPLAFNTRTNQATPIIGPNGQPVGPKLRDVPGTVRKTLFENDAALRKVEDALSAVKAYPGALGVRNYLGDTIRQRTDPDGVNARALVADIGSLKIHDRSGAAVTAAETPRLKPFVPSATDDVDTVNKKLGLFKDEYTAIQQDIRETYSRDQGYRTPEAPKTPTPPAPPPPGKPLKSAIKGQVMDGYRFKGGNPSDRNAWEKV